MAEGTATITLLLDDIEFIVTAVITRRIRTELAACSRLSTTGISKVYVQVGKIDHDDFGMITRTATFIRTEIIAMTDRT
jgi:hypothetical protein